MQRLLENFERLGWQFLQLARTDKAAFYQRSKQKNSMLHYEVIKIQHCGQHVWPNGSVSEATETYPSTVQWGMLAWTYSPASHRDPFECAKRKFEAIS
jgi:hypothetical protein